MATAARRNSPRTGTRPQAGDATGRQKAQQMKDAAPAIKEAALSTSLINVPESDEEPEVLDYSQGAGMGVREILPEEFEAMLEAGDTESDPDDDYMEPEPDGSEGDFPDGRTSHFEPPPVELDEPQPKHGRPGQRRTKMVEVDAESGKRILHLKDEPVLAEKPFKMMRVNEDLDQVTIGKDPITGDLMHYNFVQGVRYKVPRHVYDHLDRIGYVYH